MQRDERKRSLSQRMQLAWDVFLGKETDRQGIYTRIANGSYFSDSKAENISIVYTCLKILGETIGRLPLSVLKNSDDTGTEKYKDHYLYQYLHYNPNSYTTSQCFFTAIEVIRNLKGNAFARIFRNNTTGRVIRLEILDVKAVRGYIIRGGELYYKVVTNEDTGVVEEIHSNDILHFRMITKDGIWGINPIEALRSNLSTTYQAYNTIDNIYANGARVDKAIKSIASSAQSQKVMLDALEDLQNKFAGASSAGKIIPLPPNTELLDLQMNVADAQFIETIKFNANQIAALYGIPPHLVGNYEASKFNNVEQLQLNFKINTVAAIARMYRQELEYKLLTIKERNEGVSIELNLMGLVETDQKSRIEAEKNLIGVGAVTPNDVAKIEGYKTFPDGNRHYMPSNYMAIEKGNNQENQ